MLTQKAMRQTRQLYRSSISETLSDVEGKILLDFLHDTVADLQLEKLGNTAEDVETEAVVEMHDGNLASGGREN